MQFRLQSTQECSRIVSILQQRGMEFQQQHPRTNRQPSTRPSTADSDVRPLTMQRSSPAVNVPAASEITTKQNPFRLQTLEAGHLSGQNPSSSPAPSVSQSDFRQASQAGYTLAPAIPALSNSDNVHTSETGPFNSLPATRASTPLVATAIPHSPYLPQERLNIPTQPATGASTHVLAPVDLATSEASWHIPGHRLPDPTRGVTSDGLVYSNDRLNIIRPSMPSSLKMPETLEHEMPPKRELPFKRPSSHSSASSRPSTSATKAGNRSTFVGPSSESNITTTANNHGSRPVTASPLKRAFNPGDEGPENMTTTVAARPQTSTLPSTTSRRQPSASTRPLASDATFRRPSDLGELLRSTKPLANRSPNSNKISRLDSTADCPYELETPPGTSLAPSKLGGSAILAAVGNNGLLSPDKSSNIGGSLLKQQPQGVENEPPSNAATAMRAPKDTSDATLLAEYASQSQEDRQAILDEFMVSKLEDPNFALLCEDLDNCWRRIALGL